ncbi:uncharacterized protein LOC120061209 [Salvelinus namaycush]|uniref:Uncharacterized protein LOC120061209 n=1 Tax=Salvelinus namaycush TaxID=8040 RepID=A0A8U1EZA8_SALNM|nr:uncharacterized protein LOC120061209 [Salvelinus namaycush]
MESAGAATNPLPTMEERVLHHTSILHRIGSAMDQMMERMDRWERSGLPTTPPTLPPATLPSPPAGSGASALRITPPREYDGAECQGFLLQLELYLATVRPAPSDEESVSVLVSCLMGRALEWANAIWNGPDSAKGHYPEFTRGERLFHLRQGMRSALDFALEFPTLAAGAGWNDRALIDHYRCSLREDVSRELACRDTTLSLDELIGMSIRLDHLLAARGRSERVLSVSPPGPPAPIPMELGGLHLGRPEEEAPPVPIVAGEGTLPVGAGGVHLGVERAGRTLLGHPSSPPCLMTRDPYLPCRGRGRQPRASLRSPLSAGHHPS